MLGWTYGTIDDLTLFDVRDLRRYWAKHPPLLFAVGGFLGAGGGKPNRIVGVKRSQREGGTRG